MTIGIRAATEADLPAIGHISDAAFMDHPWSRAIYAVHDSPGNVRRYIDRHTKAMLEGKSNFFVAVDGNVDDPNAPVVGYSKWEAVREQKPDSEWNKPYEPWPVPDGGNQEANDLMGAALHAQRLKHYLGNPMVLLHFLVVSPDHQRKGVGGQLMKWGTDRADELGLPSWVEATNEGYGLYLRHGYQPVDQMSLDLSKYGVKELGELVIMKRTPKALSL